MSWEPIPSNWEICPRMLAVSTSPDSDPRIRFFFISLCLLLLLFPTHVWRSF